MTPFTWPFIRRYRKLRFHITLIITQNSDLTRYSDVQANLQIQGRRSYNDDQAPNVYNLPHYSKKQ